MAKKEDYFCARCNSQVRTSDRKCPNCHVHLTNRHAVVVKKTKGFGESQIMICPICGSTDVRVDFANPATWVGGAPTNYRCAVCNHENESFPEVEVSKVATYQKELGVSKKHHHIKPQVFSTLDTKTGYQLLLHRILLFLTAIGIMILLYGGSLAVLGNLFGLFYVFFGVLLIVLHVFFVYLLSKHRK